MTTNSDFEILPASWPERTSKTRKVIADFLATDLESAEIKGSEVFLHNVVRTARNDQELKRQVELRMQEKRLFIRRKPNASA